MKIHFDPVDIIPYVRDTLQRLGAVGRWHDPNRQDYRLGVRTSELVRDIMLSGYHFVPKRKGNGYEIDDEPDFDQDAELGIWLEAQARKQLPPLGHWTHFAGGIDKLGADWSTFEWLLEEADVVSDPQPEQKRGVSGRPPGKR